MHSKKTVLIVDLMNAANMELIRLDFRSSALSRHDKEFRRFCNYCTEMEFKLMMQKPDRGTSGLVLG